MEKENLRDKAVEIINEFSNVENHAALTAEQMYYLLSDENKELINRQIEILIASQSLNQLKLDYPS